MKTYKKIIVAFTFFMFFAASSAFAQQQVSELKDLIGVPGKEAEAKLKQRGFTYIKKNRSGEEIYSYWFQEKSKKCIISRMSKGRIKSIITTKESDCKRYRPVH